MRVVLGVEAGGPALVGEGRVGDDIVEGLERRVVEKFRAGQGVALLDLGSGVVVQDHIHAGEVGGGAVLLLPVERHPQVGALRRLVRDLQQQRAGAAGGVIDGGVGRRVGSADAEDLRDDAADLGGGVELALALAAFGGEVAHEIFVGVAQQVIAVRAIPREVECGVLEDGDEVGEAIHLLLAAAELGHIVEVRHVGQAVGPREWTQDPLVDLVADVRLALEGDHVGEAGTLRHGDGGERLAGKAVADVFHEQQHQYVVLVLAGIHAAAQLVAALPEG
jgi:hypothetical protein